MAYAPSDFKARFAEFAATADATVQIFIDEAALVMDTNRWGNWYNLGVGYYVAHHLVVQAKQAAGDTGVMLPVRSMRSGNASLAYDAIKEGSFSDNFFQGTNYGQQYLKLQKIVGKGAIVL